LINLELELHSAKKAKDDKKYKEKKKQLKDHYVKMLTKDIEGQMTPAVRA
jgi:hypothetical protein